MKLLTFKWHGVERLGWLLDDKKTVLAVDQKDTDLPQSIMDLINCGSYSPDQLLQVEDKLERLNIDDLDILPPIVPGTIFCVGLNYSDHAKEVGLEKTKYPTLFLRLARNHVAHGKAIQVPLISNTLDWEGELVAVIGKRCRHISADQALSYVFGYSIYNEGSVRKFQGHTSQFGLGKNFEASAAFGPVIVTADEFGNPYEKTIETRIDGELVQSAPVSNMLHKIEDVIEYISSAMELLPGDIISTGTPAGVGVGMKPPRFLREGEQVDISISGIGTLSNPVKKETTEPVVA